MQNPDEPLGAPVEASESRESASWQPIDTIPWGTRVLLWLVTVDPQNSGVVLGERGLYGTEDQDKFWDGHSYRPLAWCSHWMPTPQGPPENRRPGTGGER